jgi:hypothetical protein
MGKMIKNIKGQEVIDAEVKPVPTEENTEAQDVAPETNPETQHEGQTPEKKSFMRKIGDKIIDADEKKKLKKADKEAAKAKKQAEKAEAKANGNGAGRALKIGAAIGAGALILGSITKAVLDASASNAGTDVIQELPGEPVLLESGEATNETSSQTEEASDPVVETKEDTQSN